VRVINENTDIPVSRITLGDRPRLRPVSAEGVATVRASIEAIGLTHAIAVRRAQFMGEPGYMLMSGAHRLGAAKALGWETIRARVYECSLDEARLFEIDDNLAGSELSALELVTFMAERKRVYERLHPETRQGAAGAAARWDAAPEGEDCLNNMQANRSSFASSVAEKRGISVRQVQKLLAIGEALTPGIVAALQGAPQRRALRFSELKLLAAASPDAQALAAHRLAADEKMSPKKALGIVPPERDAEMAALLRILDAFERAPAKVRRQAARRLLEQHAGAFLAAQAGEDDAA